MFSGEIFHHFKVAFLIWWFGFSQVVQCFIVTGTEAVGQREKGSHLWHCCLVSSLFSSEVKNGNIQETADTQLFQWENHWFGQRMFLSFNCVLARQCHTSLSLMHEEATHWTNAGWVGIWRNTDWTWLFNIPFNVCFYACHWCCVLLLQWSALTALADKTVTVIISMIYFKITAFSLMQQHSSRKHFF